MGAAERRKGRVWELDVAHALTALGLPAVRHSEPGHAREDIVVHGCPWLAVEAKNCRTVDLAGWLAQAREQAGPDRVGVVVHKRRGVADPARAYVTLEMADLVRLIGMAGRL